jgi:hypothetical protein
MARGNKPSDFKGTINSLFRSTLQGLDTVREVVVQKSKQGKIQLDITLLRRKRREALADLGAAVVKLAESGKISEDKFPELGAALAKIEAIDERISDEQDRARAAGGEVIETDEPLPDDGGDDVEEYERPASKK